MREGAGIHAKRVRALVIVGTLALAALPFLSTLPRATAPYTPHAPIRITSDADFTAANGVTGGSGTTSDPYVIEGWDIALTLGSGVWIQDTRAPFLIRNVSVHGGSGGDSLGIYLVNVTGARVEGSIVADTWLGILASNAPGIIVLNNTLSSNTGGIQVYAPGSTIRGNALDRTTYAAISIGGPGSKVVENNISTGSPTNRQSIGIQLYSTSDVVVEANNVSQSGIGVQVLFTDHAGIYGNSLADNGEGIETYSSTNATLKNNTFARDGVILQGSELDHFRSHDIDLTNVVSGKPIRYYRDCDGVDIDGLPTGQLLVANCTGLAVTNLTISGTDLGLGLYFVERASVTRNTLTGNGGGVALFRTGNSTVVGNNLSGNPLGGAGVGSSWNVLLDRNNVSSIPGTGIAVVRSTGISVVRNNLTGDSTGMFVYYSQMTRLVGNLVAGSQTAIDVEDSPGGTIVLNEVRDSAQGIAIQRSGGTRIYHNDFVNNTLQAWQSFPGTLPQQIWNDTYPSGGNYWSNYTVVDLSSGPNQDLPGADGIGDTPFEFPNNAMDHYPLMRPYTPSNEPPFASFAVSPPTGDTRMTYTMDASTSWDLEDSTSSLQVRWDFQDDGTWDTPWSTAKVVQHTYPVAGIYGARLEVQDTGGLTNETTRTVAVHPPIPAAPGGLTLSRPNADDIRLDWRDMPGATSYRVYASPDRFAPFPSGWTVLGTTPLPSFVATGHATDGMTHYYQVRARNGTEEGPSSTMGVKTRLAFVFDPAKTKIAWFSLPYNSTYARASDVANELGNANIDVVGKWDPALQRSVVYYYARGGWRGTDFPMAPGDGLYLGIRSSFTWVLYGTDRDEALSFGLNPSPAKNVNWIGLPLTGAYARASSIATVLGASNVTEIDLWDPTAQTPVRWFWTGSAWAGTDFTVDPARGFYMVVASAFTWTPTLVIPARP